jgi:uncharacterized protein
MMLSQRIPTLMLASALLVGCARKPGTGPEVDPQIAAEVGRIRAIDNHAHPVRMSANGEAPDREFDALPVDNMEPSSDPVYLRPDAPGLSDAWQALFAAPQIPAKQQARTRSMSEKGAAYPAWVLDQMGVEIMLANRVAMGTGIAPPRFRWVPYADALIFPLDNSALARANSDRKSFFALEDNLRARYLQEAGLPALPGTLADYLARVVTPTLERQRQGGAVAEKFEAAYLRSLAFDKADRAAAERIYSQFHAAGVPSDADYKDLQDFLFRYVAAECGRLGMAVHLHTMAGAGSYFDVRGANPLLLEPVLNDPELRKTKFVMVHGGWPFIHEITPLLEKPNAYLDYSSQSLLLPPAALARSLREWLEWVPEKVLFGTDAYPYSDSLGWEESGWLAAKRGREALSIALTAMVRDGEVSPARALELARLVLRENAKALYGL